MGSIVLTDELLDYLGEQFQVYKALCERMSVGIKATTFEAFVESYIKQEEANIGGFKR